MLKFCTEVSVLTDLFTQLVPRNPGKKCPWHPDHPAIGLWSSCKSDIEGIHFKMFFVFKIIQNSKLFIFCPQLWQVLLGFFAFPSWERPQLLTVPQCLSYSCLIPVHLWQPCAYLTFCRVRGPELHDNVGCSWRSKNSKEQTYGTMLTRYNGSAFIYKSVCCTLFSSSCFFSLCQYCCY